MDILEILKDYKFRLKALLGTKNVMLLDNLRYKKELIEVETEIDMCLYVINNIEGTLNVLKIDSMF